MSDVWASPFFVRRFYPTVYATGMTHPNTISAPAKQPRPAHTMRPIEQQFFNDLEKKLWTAADKPQSNLDAAVSQSQGITR